jgi:hypothetical protein
MTPVGPRRAVIIGIAIGSTFVGACLGGQPTTDASLTVANEQSMPIVVRLEGPTVGPVAFRLDAHETARLIERTQSPGIDPSLTLRALAPDCTLLTQASLALTGHLLVRITGTALSSSTQRSPVPASSEAPLPPEEACPDSR